jgi:hypothetical protein
MLVLKNEDLVRIGAAMVKMKESPDRGFPHLARVPRWEAFEITKAHMASQGLGVRGGVYTFDDAANGIAGVIIHGEYGHFAVTLNDEGRRAELFASPQYTFHDRQVPGLVDMSKSAALLMVRAMCVGFSLEAIVQWFDSVYRLHTNRRVSPNFDPRQTFDKMTSFIAPGVNLLENKYKGLLSNDRPHKRF